MYVTLVVSRRYELQVCATSSPGEKKQVEPVTAPGHSICRE